MGAPEDDRLDSDLVERTQRGDQDAFAVLARTHSDRLVGIAHRGILADAGRGRGRRAADAGDRIARTSRPPRCNRFDAWLQRLLVNASYAEARRWRTWSARTYASSRIDGAR